MFSGKFRSGKRLIRGLAVALPVVWLGTAGSVWARERFGLGKDAAAALGMFALLMGVAAAAPVMARESNDAGQGRPPVFGAPWFLRLAVPCAAGATAGGVYRAWYEGRLPDGRAALLLAAIVAGGALAGWALRDRPPASLPASDDAACR